ncbi:Zinc finger protein 407 [Dissostichus eleginoides]|uniref:Zinc finger protein 407 n=1 Tax=Dissostichus eleginoides TaxID=100907 RepID=A0AAD9C6G7_DISEL|nr:Zinc finger protein 407 [Dissostichus eleginoides]
MDETVTSEKEAVEDKVPDTVSCKVQQDDVDMEGNKKDPTESTAKPDEAEDELAKSLLPDSVPVDRDTICTNCGFSAKCPRSLKIHYARKHGKNSKNNKRTAKLAEKSEKISDLSPSEIHQEVDMETESAAEVQQNNKSDSDELGSGSNEMKTKHLTKKQTELDKEQADQEEAIPTQERRVSKRTPKPKMIYSCNYCGQEFRDKSPLDVHIQSYHTKDSQFTFEAGENMDAEKDTEDPGSTLKATPTRVAAKRPLSRFQLKCTKCDFRVSNPSLLESHTRIKHMNQQWYRCKLCNFFSATSEWMDVHLSSDSHMQQQKEEKSMELSASEVYVESVARDSIGESGKVDDTAQVATGEDVDSAIEGHQETEEAVEAAEADSVEEEDFELQSPKRKRGRPKQVSTTTCGYCGLVVSNATNLSVHVRRKHSKEYGYSCTLCNYSCVTKGDMDRHCITKKHVRRAQDCSNKNQVDNHTSPSPQESTSQCQEPDAAPQTPDKESESDNTASNEQSGEEQTQSDTSQNKRSEGQRDAALPLKQKEDIDLEEANSNPECEPNSPKEESDSFSGDSQVVESQNPAELSVTTEHVDAVAELSESKQAVTDVQPSVDQPESQEEVEEQADEEQEMIVDAKSGKSPPDTQMSKALPFDACIVSWKALAEQELQEGLALEGEAAVICLTGGSPVTGYLPSHSAYVKKITRKEMKGRKEAKGSGSRIRCDDCGFMADGISGLNVHISMKHPSKDKHFHCLVCGNVEELPEGGASFKCVKCTDRFESEQELFVHIKEKHEELLREVNKYVVEDTEQINREREENQGSVCKYCGKVCKSSNSMAFLAHIRTHTGSKPFMCKICNFATAQLGDARNHVKRHLGMREYKCDICGMGLVHVRVFMSPLSCEIVWSVPGIAHQFRPAWLIRCNVP